MGVKLLQQTPNSIAEGGTMTSAYAMSDNKIRLEFLEDLKSHLKIPRESRVPLII